MSYVNTLFMETLSTPHPTPPSPPPLPLQVKSRFSSPQHPVYLASLQAGLLLVGQKRAFVSVGEPGSTCATMSFPHRFLLQFLAVPRESRLKSVPVLTEVPFVLTAVRLGKGGSEVLRVRRATQPTCLITKEVFPQGAHPAQLPSCLPGSPAC